jgi:hypothetical protein
LKNVSHLRAFSLLHSFRSSHIEYIHAYTLDLLISRVRRDRDRMVVGFTTTCAIIAFHHWSCEFEPRSWRGVLYTALCDKVCQQLATGRWFSPGTLISSTNKTDRHDITKILLKVALSTIYQTKPTNHILVDFKSSLEHVLYVYYVSTRNKTLILILNWICRHFDVREDGCIGRSANIHSSASTACLMIGCVFCTVDFCNHV